MNNWLLPRWKLHEFTEIGDRVNDQEKTVPEAGAGKHGVEVQIKVLGNTENNCDMTIK